ncbi:DUF4241 domain-containing protein [Amycolatopsis sp. WQ 127309]|uniref:DUF4241 domain-containing protein n=1 Tax=Amycolatopsis sp. WQ 127309 TaxID=2932773 RepID=UPI001FF4D19E|nr:DUF4241 domain-containing protein [Amycolatopsis sp. WQ 127309]UOZ06952.1 DUF4241 domain-containing protein [Amycolatopsis sp. WQ 127309]
MPIPTPGFDRIFAPGARHELSGGDIVTVRLRRQGSLWLPSGQVVAGEPFGFDAATRGFVQRVPPGQYPLELVIALFAARGHLPEHELVAAARLVIRDEPVVSWELAACPGQDAAELAGDEFFGYPVDAGAGGFADVVNLPPPDEDPDEFQDRVMNLLDYTKSDAPVFDTVTDGHGRPIVVAFPSGNGDGRYPTWVGRGAAGDVVCFLTDFFVLTGEDDDEWPPAGGIVPGHELRAGQVLRRQALSSPSGRATLVHQDDGNLVLYDNEGRGTVWSAGTPGRGTGCCALQPDGDFVVYDDQARAVWSTGTAGHPGAVLSVHDDGLVLRDPAGSVVWSTTPRAAGASVIRPLFVATAGSPRFRAPREQAKPT